MEDYVIPLFLITLSALFSGLTLGYFTLNPQELRRQAKLGNTSAARVLPIRQRGNQLLTTLLLGNVAVNAVLSIFLSSIASGVVAAITATSLIFLFGEIIPQAVIARHALYFGSLCAPIVRFIMILAWPVAWPVAFMLDKLLGDEIPSVYSKKELMELISEHEDSEHSGIDEDEERIIHGALQFSHTKVREAMTPFINITSYDINERITDTFLEHVNEAGYSRYPIYDGEPGNIVGILFTKDLIVEDDDIAIGDTEEAFENEYMTIRPDTTLDSVLTRMLKERRHMAIVKNSHGQCLGLITLEDIIEEIIQVEIVDEDDED